MGEDVLRNQCEGKQLSDLIALSDSLCECTIEGEPSLCILPANPTPNTELLGLPTIRMLAPRKEAIIRCKYTGFMNYMTTRGYYLIRHKGIDITCVRYFGEDLS